MTTVKLFGGDLGIKTMLVRCNLTQASAPVQVDYCTGKGFVPTLWQCADTLYMMSGLIKIGKLLAANAVEVPRIQFTCDAEVVD